MAEVIQPYYQDEWVTIYNADCRDVLPTLDKVDLVLTDPPYGIQGGTGGTSRQRGRGMYKGAFTSEDDTPEFIERVVVPVIRMCIEISTAVIATPGCKNFSMYPQPDSFGTIFQPQSAGAQRWGWTDSQPIFYYGKSPLQGKRLEPCSWTVTEQVRGIDHPCPKPISFWRKLLQKGMAGNGTVLDPFMGSGTTLRAAKDLNRKAIGIEIEERYCEIAAKRMSQLVMELK